MNGKQSQMKTFPNYQIYTCKMKCSMEEAEDALREALKSQKFGVVSTVDVQKTINQMIGGMIRPYVIVGACKPSHAYKVINLEKDVGLLLPCNVLLQEKEVGVVTFGFMNPRIVDIFTKNPEITKIVKQVIIELAQVAQKLDPDYITCKGIPTPNQQLQQIPHYQKCSVILKTDMDDAQDRLRKVIKGEKYGIVSVVDVQKTVKKKIGKDIRPYIILGAFCPIKALQAIKHVEDIGILMPFNFLLQEIEPGTVKVGFQNPLMIETFQNIKIGMLLRDNNNDITRMFDNLQMTINNKDYTIEQQQYLDFRNKMKYIEEAEKMKDFPNVFMEIQIEGKHLGRIEFELFSDTPKTSYNFKCLCTGEKIVKNQGLQPVSLGYKGSRIHKIIPQFMIQGGDITRGDGTGGDSIYGVTFSDENFIHKHDKPFMLSMGNRGEPNTNSSQFFITLKPCTFLDNHNVCFGQVLKGQKVVKKLEGYGQKNGEVKQKIQIQECGVCRIF